MTADGGDPWTTSHAHWGFGVASFLAADLPRAERAERQALDIIARVDEGSCMPCASRLWRGSPRLAVHTNAPQPCRAPAPRWEWISGRLPPPMHVHARRCEQRVVQALGAARRARCYDEGRQVAAPRRRGPGPGITSSRERHRGRQHLRSLLQARTKSQGSSPRDSPTARSPPASSSANAPPRATCTTSSPSLGFRSRTQIATWVTQRRQELRQLVQLLHELVLAHGRRA